MKKDTITACCLFCGHNTKMISFLNAVPYLQYTTKGINNIAHRFGISPEHLIFLIDVVSKGGLFVNGN